MCAFQYFGPTTNIFLEWLLGQKRAKECEQLLLLVEQGKLNAFILSWALHSIEYLLYTRGGSTVLLAHFLHKIHLTPGLTVWQTTAYEEYLALQFTKKHYNGSYQQPKMQLDFDDALHYYIASTPFLNSTIVSFDTDFDATDIIRLEPKDILTDMNMTAPTAQ